MLYQQLLMGSKPYHIGIARMEAFEMHRHPEIEFIYCLNGACSIMVSRRVCRIETGDLMIIGSMTPHEILPGQDGSCRALVMEAGPVLLGEYFDPLAKMAFPDPILPREGTEELRALFRETAGIMERGEPFYELCVRGNIYKICAFVLQRLMESSPPSTSKSLSSVSNIEKALELIDSRFNEELSVDYVASVCGYGKSNFCRIFKRITGDTFHNALTRHRIQAAQNLLRETDASVESIAQQTGFADAKSLCRAFRRMTGMTPGAHRKCHKAAHAPEAAE